MRSFILLLAAMLLISCDVGPQPAITKSVVLHNFSYGDQKDQRRFKDALAQSDVPHKIYTGADGKEYVQWSGEDNDRVENIQASLFGERLAANRAIHFNEPRHSQFKKWLTANRIPFTTEQSGGREYVVWDEADYERLAKWKHFPRDTYDKLKKLTYDDVMKKLSSDNPVKRSEPQAARPSP